ncbi:MAG: UDP-2,4-diacetamido-2,4,6-trideoxy-beta-L-altropyranose hydrolase [Mariniblastus sp.]|nr:UDP-2,4-diacetamido-2,4,6-trideoxy-beta-L-altropyranose hydrolase [Mariniblastus sp.]
MRCLALGQSWQKMGGRVTLLTSSLPARLAKRVDSEQFELHMLPNGCAPGQEMDTFNELIVHQQPDWVVLDGYRFDDPYQREICLQGARLLVVDDYGHANHAWADAIFNQNVYAETENYERRKRNQDIIAGLDYVLIRDEFHQADEIATNRRQIALGHAKRILVTFGGADPQNTTRDVIRTLDRCAAKGTTLDVIVGPCNPHLPSLKTVARQSKLSIRFHTNVDRMASLFERSDLAITAAGSTCYELCHAGVPMIAIPIASNQVEIAHCLHAKGAAVTLQPTALHEEHGQELIRQVIRQPATRQSMSLMGRQLVDGQGASRLARRLCSHLYRFRKAEPRDTAMLLDWQNDSEIRATRFGATATEPNQPSGNLPGTAPDAHPVHWIVENGSGRPVGQILLESIESNRTAIAINLVPSIRGRGIGTSLIEAGCRLAKRILGPVEFVAHIKPVDFASQAAFRKAGFKTVATTTINGQVALEFSLSPNHLATEQVVADQSRRAS